MGRFRRILADLKAALGHTGEALAVVLVAIGYAIVSAVLFKMYPLPGIFLLSATIAFALFLIILPVIPGMIGALANNPNRYRPDDPEEANKRTYEPSHFGFFTSLAPGQSKWIESQGERAIRAPMRNPEKMYEGEKKENTFTGRNPDYWEVAQTEGGYEDSHPIPFPLNKWKGWKRSRWFFYSTASVPWWVWKRWVYEITGYVWVGTFPYRRLRVSRVDRYNILELEDGEEKLVLVRDYSDHYRVIDFQFPVIVPAALTKDKFRVRVEINGICRVINTYKVAYFTDDRWSVRLTGAFRNAIINFMRTRDVDDVLTPDEKPRPEAENALAEAIKAIGEVIGEVMGEARSFGIYLPVLPQIRQLVLVDDKDREALNRPRRARAEMEADNYLAKGKAAYLNEQGQALYDHPEALAAGIPQIEGWIDTARELNNGNNTGILNIGGGAPPINPVEIAQLGELRKLRGQSQTPAPPETEPDSQQTEGDT